MSEDPIIWQFQTNLQPLQTDNILLLSQAKCKIEINPLPFFLLTLNY